MTSRLRVAADSRRSIAAVAVVAAAVDLLVFVTLHVVSPEVSVRDEPTSNYVHTAWGALVPVGQVAFGLACVAVGIIWRRHRFPATLLMVVGAAKLALAIFPIDQAGTAPTTAGVLHNVLGNVAFWLLPLATALLARPLARSGHRWVAVVGLLLLPATALVLVGAAADFFGWAQRLYLLLATCWVLLTGVAALRTGDSGSGRTR